MSIPTFISQVIHFTIPLRPEDRRAVETNFTGRTHKIRAEGVRFQDDYHGGLRAYYVGPVLKQDGQPRADNRQSETGRIDLTDLPDYILDVAVAKAKERHAEVMESANGYLNQALNALNLAIRSRVVREG